MLADVEKASFYNHFTDSEIRVKGDYRKHDCTKINDY